MFEEYTMEVIEFKETDTVVVASDTVTNESEPGVLDW